MGVSLVNNTTLNARGPAIIRRIALPVSFFINLKMLKNIERIQMLVLLAMEFERWKTNTKINFYFKNKLNASMVQFFGVMFSLHLQ